MKFAHMGDCHLGGWKQQEMRELNFRSFQTAIEKCIKERVEFIIITGDLFDNAYPSIDTLKDAFQEFRKLKEAGIPVFLIAGSHDYSISGKTFLDVLEKAGLCRNVSNYEEHNGVRVLLPTLYKNVAIYGYPGKKSGLEVEEISNIKLQDSPGLFKILMLHTAIRDAVGNLPIDSVDERALPKVDYLALSHLHIIYSKMNRVYSGPIFPNNISELEELQHGFFYIFDNGRITREELKIKEVAVFSMEVRNALKANDDIIAALEQENFKDKIVVLKLSGIIDRGKIGDINLGRIEQHLKNKESYAVLFSTSRLYSADSEIKIEHINAFSLEQEIIKRFEASNPGKFNHLIVHLMKVLHMEKAEEEKSAVFEERLMSEANKILFT